MCSDFTLDAATSDGSIVYAHGALGVGGGQRQQARVKAGAQRTAALHSSDKGQQTGFILARALIQMSSANMHVHVSGKLACQPACDGDVWCVQQHGL